MAIMVYIIWHYELQSSQKFRQKVKIYHSVIILIGQQVMQFNLPSCPMSLILSTIRRLRCASLMLY